MKKISSVKIMNDYKILIIFDKGEKKLCDIKPLLKKGDFRELKDPSKFNTFKSIGWGVEWDNGLDLNADTLDVIGSHVNESVYM
jgi:hypothetical protein